MPYICKMKVNFSKYNGVAAVYTLHNKNNGKRYVGSTMNLYKRIGLHKSSLLKGKPNHRLLFEDYIEDYDLEKYDIRFKTFKTDVTEEFIRMFEERCIQIFKPELNISKYPSKGNGKPNLGKKFSKEWRDNMHRCRKHSEETLLKITNINKENSCKLKFQKDGSTLNFDSWVEASKYFNSTKGAIYQSFKRRGKYKGYSINKLNNQMKRVKIEMNGEIHVFNSCAECDRFLDLWRGCTSNAIKHNGGMIGNVFVEHVE